MKEGYVYRPFRFFFITFLLTWVTWFIAAFFSYQKGMELYQILFMVPGLLAPLIAAVIMIFSSKNKELKKDFLDKLLNLKRIKLSYIPVILLLMPISVLLSILLSLLFGKSIHQFSFSNEFSFSAAGVPVLLILFLASTFEELGWRGYGMDSLRSKFTMLKATILFAVFWVLWHLPLFFINGYYQNELWNTNIIYVVNFFISVLPLAIILNWLYYKNNRSIIASISFHFIANLSAEAFQMEQFSKCIQTVVLLVISIIIIIKDKEFFFDKKKTFI